MKSHKVKAGKHNYRPGHGFKLLRQIRRLSLVASIGKSAWFDPTRKGPLKSDGKDLNKVAGVSFARPFAPSTWAKNRNSVLIAWRPAEKYGFFELAAYVNDKKGGFKYSDPILVKAGEVFICDVSIFFDTAKFFFTVNGESVVKVLSGFDSRGRAIPVGPWFGGNRKSPTSHSVLTSFKMLSNKQLWQR